MYICTYIFFNINSLYSQNFTPHWFQCCVRLLSIDKFVVNRSFSGTQAQKVTLTATKTTRATETRLHNKNLPTLATTESTLSVYLSVCVRDLWGAPQNFSISKQDPNCLSISLARPVCSHGWEISVSISLPRDSNEMCFSIKMVHAMRSNLNWKIWF